jgi:AraC-like DNA-binding protein
VQLTTVTPHPEIARWIHHFWVFASPTGLPSSDLRVVVPNGRHKLIVQYRNGLTAAGGGATRDYREGQIVLVGLWEAPSIISSSPTETCTIGVEFVAHGLMRFFDGDLHELSQRIVALDDVLGRAGRELSSRVNSAPTIAAAVDEVQRFLLARCRALAPECPPLVDAAMRLLAESDFRMEVNDLERRMGYSRRYLHALFQRHVGLPPKRLASVLAFERLYRRFSQSKSAALLRDDALDLFYDQSHFIRTFRRFTGFSPGRFADLDNEFGRIFYRAS